jgi:hypothetical protein
MGTPVVGNIHIGQGEVYLGGTPPAAGSDPTDPTAGTPSALNAMATGFTAPVSGGTYTGFTFGPATLTYRPTYYMVVTEQAFSEVVAVPTSEEASLAFTALEQTYSTIAAAWGQAITRTTTGVQAVYVGSKPTLATKVVTLVSRKRSGVGYYITTMYSAYSSDGATVSFERRAESRLPVTMRALADVARPEGDQLFQLAAYDANPA